MSEPVDLSPSLPVVWRPWRTRLVAYVMAGVVVIGAVVLAAVLPDPFRLPDRIGVVLFALLVAGVLHLLGRCRVVADERGLTAVNALRTHRLEWAEVLDVHLLVGEPWAKLDLADGSSLAVMGIQGSEKARAHRAVRELRALISKYGEAPEPR